MPVLPNSGDRSSCVPLVNRVDNLEETVNNLVINNTGIEVQEESVTVAGGPHTILDFIGATVTAADAGGGRATITIAGGAGTQNLWETIEVVSDGGTAGGGDLVAATPTDTLTIAAGLFISLATDGVSTLTIGLDGVTSFSVVDPSAGSTLTAAVLGDTLYVNGTTGIVVTGSTPGGLNTLTLSVNPTVLLAEFDEGDGIAFDGPEINVDLADTAPCLEFDGTGPPADLRVKADPVGGLERHADGLRDKWRYHLVRGQATSAQTPGGPSIDNVVSVHGETPVSGAGDTLIPSSVLNLYVANNDLVYALYNNDADTGTPILEAWSTDTMANLRPILAGLPGYDPAFNMLLGHSANATDASQQSIDWKSVAGWLLTLPVLSNPTHILGKSGSDVGWVPTSACP